MPCVSYKIFGRLWVSRGLSLKTSYEGMRRTRFARPYRHSAVDPTCSEPPVPVCALGQPTLHAPQPLRHKRDGQPDIRGAQ